MLNELFIDNEELEKWEEEQELSKYVNFKAKSSKTKDTGLKRRKELEKAEKIGWYFFSHEEKSYRKVYQRTFRQKWKVERSKERYHIPRTREYKTYGYLTW